MFCSTNIINYTFVIEILRKLYVSWSNNSERDTTRRFKLNGGKEKNKIRKKKVPLYTSVEQLEIKVLEMLRCFFQRCMVDSRMIIDAFRNVESRRRDGTTSDFQRRKRRAHTSLLSFFFFLSRSTRALFSSTTPVPDRTNAPAQDGTGPNRSIWLGFPCFDASYLSLPPPSPRSDFRQTVIFSGNLSVGVFVFGTRFLARFPPPSLLPSPSILLSSLSKFLRF